MPTSFSHDPSKDVWSIVHLRAKEFIKRYIPDGWRMDTELEFDLMHQSWWVKTTIVDHLGHWASTVDRLAFDKREDYITLTATYHELLSTQQGIAL